MRWIQASSVTKTITEENKYSNPVALQRKFNFSLTGTFVATVVVQRSFDDGINWLDVATFTAPGEFIGEEPEKNMRYRFGVKTGAYTSGSIIGRLSQ